MSQQSINNFKCREGKKEWKTTEEAAMAATQKAVESTAMQVKDQEFHVQAHAAAKELSAVKTDQEDHLERVTTVREDRSVRTAKDQEGHSEKVLKEEVSEATVQEDLLERTMTDHADLSEKVLKEEAVSRIQEERVSTRRTSTISVTRTKAESTR